MFPRFFFHFFFYVRQAPHFFCQFHHFFQMGLAASSDHYLAYSLAPILYVGNHHPALRASASTVAGAWVTA